ncbi:MAG TPA: DNA-binding protein, partial [Roseiflexaceae bacterium]|nr:DNA-binding protein [Roseiflexaceae bacterium]
MAPKVATQESVNEAAEALLAAGQEPTLRAVQERTKGSYSTVKRHLEVWQAQRKAAPPVVEPPPEVL